MGWLAHGEIDGKPILFETMVFSEDDNQVLKRYCSWEEAERGHQSACDALGIKRQLPSFIDGEVVPEVAALPAPDPES